MKLSLNAKVLKQIKRTRKLLQQGNGDEASRSIHSLNRRAYVQVETMVLRVKKRAKASRTKRTNVVVGSVGSEREESRRVSAVPAMVVGKRGETGAPC